MGNYVSYEYTEVDEGHLRCVDLIAWRKVRCESVCATRERPRGCACERDQSCRFFYFFLLSRGRSPRKMRKCEKIGVIDEQDRSRNSYRFEVMKWSPDDLRSPTRRFRDYVPATMRDVATLATLRMALSRSVVWHHHRSRNSFDGGRDLEPTAACISCKARASACNEEIRAYDHLVQGKGVRLRPARGASHGFLDQTSLHASAFIFLSTHWPTSSLSACFLSLISSSKA